MSSSKSKSYDCITCKLRDGNVQSPVMEPYGDGDKGILIIGEAPGKAEDRSNMHWQGRTGKMLHRVLSQHGIKLFRDCVCVNAVNCRPPENRTPKKLEIDCCREMIVRKTIEDFKPNVIVLLGSSAVKSFLQDRWPTDLGGINKWRGWVIPDQDYDAWVIPTFHPSFIARASSPEYDTIWEQDLQEISRSVGVEVPRTFEPEIHYIEDLRILERFMDSEKMAFDYETNHLRGMKRGARIISASVAFDDQQVFTFMMPHTKQELRPWFNLLTNPNIKKMAHNMKFENQWSLHRYGIEVQNWYWDSMLAAHQLDNRSGITGLKFQSYVNFGVIYGDEVLPFLRRNDADPAGFNKIDQLMEDEIGQKKLLTYGAYDSHYEFRLAQKQLLELDYELPF